MMTVTIAVERIPGTEDLPLPRYMTDGAAGMDVVAACPEPVTLAPLGRSLIPTGLKLAVPVGFEVQVRMRSGLALKHGLALANGVGTIDCDYRGEVGVILVNLGAEPFTVSRGLRIAQLVVQPVLRARLEVVAAVEATVRGAGGFGSTGAEG